MPTLHKPTTDDNRMDFIEFKSIGF